jgi:hypothetical protein
MKEKKFGKKNCVREKMISNLDLASSEDEEMCVDHSAVQNKSDVWKFLHSHKFSKVCSLEIRFCGEIRKRFLLPCLSVEGPKIELSESIKIEGRNREGYFTNKAEVWWVREVFFLHFLEKLRCGNTKELNQHLLPQLMNFWQHNKEWGQSARIRMINKKEEKITNWVQGD